METKSTRNPEVVRRVVGEEEEVEFDPDPRAGERVDPVPLPVEEIDEDAPSEGEVPGEDELMPLEDVPSVEDDEESPLEDDLVEDEEVPSEDDPEDEPPEDEEDELPEEDDDEEDEPDPDPWRLCQKEVASKNCLMSAHLIALVKCAP